jgi:hypothetical protein
MPLLLRDRFSIRTIVIPPFCALRRRGGATRHRGLLLILSTQWEPQRGLPSPPQAPRACAIREDHVIGAGRAGVSMITPLPTTLRITAVVGALGRHVPSGKTGDGEPLAMPGALLGCTALL